MPKWDVSFNTRVEVDRPDALQYTARAHARASVIREIPIPPVVQQRMDALNILRAVRGTTGIEGSDLSEDEVRQVLDAPPGKSVLPPARRREEQEARNAQQVMSFIVARLSEDPNLPVTEELICKIHEITTNGIDYSNNEPGKYRMHAVAAGTYVPPRTGEEVRSLMTQFVHWLNMGLPTTWDPVVRAIVAHFYVLSIHPFGDGNGRTARGLESLLLYQVGINARGFYSLANYYYRNRDQYVRLLDHVRFETNGDLTPFVIFALRGLEEELETVYHEVLDAVRLISFRDYARETLLLHGKLGTKAGERMFHFLLELSVAPVSLRALQTGAHALSRYYRKVTPRTLARDLLFLRQHEFVTVEGDSLMVNLGVMTRFTPPAALPSPRVTPREPQRKRR